MGPLPVLGRRDAGGRRGEVEPARAAGGVLRRAPVRGLPAGPRRARRRCSATGSPRSSSRGSSTRVPYQAEGERQRHEYRLTAKGRDLYPTLVALMQWGDTYLADGPPPLELQHRDCGAAVHLELGCEAGPRGRRPARGPPVRRSAPSAGRVSPGAPGAPRRPSGGPPAGGGPRPPRRRPGPPTRTMTGKPPPCAAYRCGSRPERLLERRPALARRPAACRACCGRSGGRRAACARSTMSLSGVAPGQRDVEQLVAVAADVDRHRRALPAGDLHQRRPELPGVVVGEGGELQLVLLGGEVGDGRPRRGDGDPESVMPTFLP